MYVHQISCSMYSLKLATCSIPSHEDILAKFKIMLKIGFVFYINTADLCAFYILSHLIPSSNAFSCRKGRKKMSGESRAAAVGHLLTKMDQSVYYLQRWHLAWVLTVDG